MSNINDNVCYCEKCDTYFTEECNCLRERREPTELEKKIMNASLKHLQERSSYLNKIPESKFPGSEGKC